jgi:ATP-binding protein involved in chromosome partitioning
LASHAHSHAAPQTGPQPLPGIQTIIAIGSGKGGVGKTTIAVNLAVALSKLGYRVGLLDGDIYGPNVPLMMGALDAQPKALEGNRIQPIEQYGIKMISVGLLNPGDKPVIWRGPMLHSIIRQFLQQVEWGELDYLIIDLPPGTGDVAISLIQTVPVSGAVVISTPSDVALQDARKAIEMFKQLKVDIYGLVENMSHFTCPHCKNEIDIFSKEGGSRTAKQYELPLLAQIELDPELRRAGDAGQPLALAGEAAPHAGALYAMARAVVAKAKEVGSGESVIHVK